MGCERHKSKSTIQENEFLVKFSLNEKEEVADAFLQKDYSKLSEILSLGRDINGAVSGNKNLLVMAIESKDYRMVDFILGYKADPFFVIKYESGDYTPFQVAESIKDDEGRDVMVKVLTGKLEEVAEILYYDGIYPKTASANSLLDLSWIARLLSYEINHESLEYQDFKKVYIGNKGKYSNFSEFHFLLNKKIKSETQKLIWKEWTERDFVDGKYKTGKCKFVERNTCETFDSFLESCDEKTRKKFSRAKSKIVSYITLRNALISCPG